MKSKKIDFYTDEEICQVYRDAKYKKKQIRILADMNRVSTQHIEEILLENGYEVPGRSKPETLTKTERDEQAARDFTERLRDTGDKNTEMPEIAVRFPNYTPPKPVWDLVEQRIEELNALTEHCTRILNECVEECGRLREFQVAYGVGITGEKISREPEVSNRRGGNDGSKGV